MTRKAKTVLALACISCAAALLAQIPASAMASHTVLCHKNEAVCAKGNLYSTEFATELTGYVGFAGTWMELELPKLTTLACSTGKLGTSLKVQAEGSMTGEVNRWPFFTPCSPSGCTIKTTPAEAPMKYPAELKAVGGGDGLLSISSPVLIANCTTFPFIFKCTYSTGTMQVSVEGGGEKEGEHAYLATQTALAWQSGASCPVTANFRATYQVYEPGTAVYVTN